MNALAHLFHRKSTLPYSSHLPSLYEKPFPTLTFGRMNIEPTILLSRLSMFSVEGIFCEFFWCRLDYRAVSGHIKFHYVNIYGICFMSIRFNGCLILGHI